jgi:hypothetical protein
MREFFKSIIIKILKVLIPVEQVRGSSIVVDLDRMISKPVGILFQDRVYQIKPMTMRVFIESLATINNLDEIRKQKDFTREQIIDGYLKVFSACSNFGRKEIEAMNDAQIAAILGQIVSSIKGESHANPTLKKKVKMELNPAF